MECEIPTINTDLSYDAIKEELSSQQYWVRFFMRPCCPPAGDKAAHDMTDRLKAEIDACTDFTDAEREELVGLVDEHLKWYLGLSIRHSA